MQVNTSQTGAAVGKYLTRSIHCKMGRLRLRGLRPCGCYGKVMHFHLHSYYVFEYVHLCACAFVQESVCICVYKHQRLCLPAYLCLICVRMHVFECMSTCGCVLPCEFVFVRITYSCDREKQFWIANRRQSIISRA